MHPPFRRAIFLSSSHDVRVTAKRVEHPDFGSDVAKDSTNKKGNGSPEHPQDESQGT